VSGLPVPVVSPPDPPQALTRVCANCQTPLTGPYCTGCGQRHEPHIHTLAHFAGEAFEVISHADSRLWRTLWYLVSRPGFLTREFFQGRRVQYLPPFRLYLVISVLFFLVVGVPGGHGVAVSAASTPAERAAKLKAVARDLQNGEQGPASDTLKMTADALNRQAERELAAADPANAAKDGALIIPDGDGMKNFCDSIKNRGSLHAACARMAEDNGEEFGKSVVHNIPRAMFVFLPLLAFAVKLLYWRPKRYYVEHLLFLIHNHAFVFLALSMLALLKMIPVVGKHVGAVEAFVWLYLVWYLFRAMRNFYQQGRWLTLAKYFAIGFSYTVAAVTVLLLTAVYSAMTLA
jgi:hypothetical protein